MLGAAIGAMYGLKAKAQTLMQIPTEDGIATAGPTFEYVGPDRRPAQSAFPGAHADSALYGNASSSHSGT